MRHLTLRAAFAFARLLAVLLVGCAPIPKAQPVHRSIVTEPTNSGTENPGKPQTDK